MYTKFVFLSSNTKFLDRHDRWIILTSYTYFNYGNWLTIGWQTSALCTCIHDQHICQINDLALRSRNYNFALVYCWKKLKLVYSLEHNVWKVKSHLYSTANTKIVCCFCIMKPTLLNVLSWDFHIRSRILITAPGPKQCNFDFPNLQSAFIRAESMKHNINNIFFNNCKNHCLKIRDFQGVENLQLFSFYKENMQHYGGFFVGSMKNDKFT